MVKQVTVSIITSTVTRANNKRITRMPEAKENNLLIMPNRNNISMSDAVRDAFGLKNKVMVRAGEGDTRSVVLENSLTAKTESDNSITEKKTDTFYEVSPENASKLAVSSISIEAVSLSPYQTREILDDSELTELANSIRSKGVIQPVIVREVSGESSYELVAGERRLRASKIAGKTEIPALVMGLSDRDSMELSIIENAQREDLNPIEEALAYRRLLDEFKITQQEIAAVIGKERSTISNSLRLLQLEPEVLELIKAEKLSSGHGRALLAIKEPKVQLRIAKKAAADGLSVRAVEEIVSSLNSDSSKRSVVEQDQRLTDLLRKHQEKIGETLGLESVSLRLDQNGVRRLNIVFETEASWKRFMSRIRD
jgi:ParB family chromosome partitioning protein